MHKHLHRSITETIWTTLGLVDFGLASLSSKKPSVHYLELIWAHSRMINNLKRHQWQTQIEWVFPRLMCNGDHCTRSWVEALKISREDFLIKYWVYWPRFPKNIPAQIKDNSCHSVPAATLFPHMRVVSLFANVTFIDVEQPQVEKTNTFYVACGVNYHI